jgi:hypothetical protein
MEMLVDEKDLADIDLDLLEEDYNKKYLKSLPPKQLYKFHKVYIVSTAGATSRSGGGLGIHLDPNKDNWKMPKEIKCRGHKSTQQLIREVGRFMINSGQIQKLIEGFFSPSLLYHHKDYLLECKRPKW